MLTTEQKQTFAEEGYLVFKDLLPKRLIEEILREGKIIENQETPSYAPEGVLKFWDARVILHYPAFIKALEYPSWRGILESIGSDYQLIKAELSSGLVLCPSGQGLEDWHRDIDYYDAPEFDPNHLIVIIYLQDTISPEVGPSRIIPGSHKSDYQLNHDDSFEPVAGEVTLAFPAGTVILWKGNLWNIHGPNNSDKDYWALIYNYGRLKAT